MTARTEWRIIGWGIVAVFVIGGMYDLAPYAYRYFLAHPFALLFICGGLTLAYVLFLLWWGSRMPPGDYFCADDTRKPWEEVE